jgi:hypothetical protein
MTKEFYIKTFSNIQNSMLESIYSINDMDNIIQAEYLHIETELFTRIYNNLLSTNFYIFHQYNKYNNQITHCRSILNEQERLGAFADLAEKIEIDRIKKIKLPLSENQTCKVLDLWCIN